jgi:DNA invertase Pin-like site-specific DNA recombinase
MTTIETSTRTEARPKSASWELRSEKIAPEHRERLAAVYVRQSTPQQVLNNQESTRLQYGLKTRAVHLGWSEERVLVIDDDLGKSGATAEGRTGFQRLVSEVSLGHVGIILGVEMSRLARSCKDWHQLLELCGIFGTLIADLDGVYDPGNYNDRLLLGLKGTMSEAELHIIKQRMNQGRLQKAKRGELVFDVPAGYVRLPSGEIALDPDEQVQSVVRLIFRKYSELGTAGAVLKYLVRHGIQIGIRARVGPERGELQWRRPTYTKIRNFLTNPMYAGAYSFGRRQVDHKKRQPGKHTVGDGNLPRERWYTLLRDRVPAYITWDEFEEHLACLKSNQCRPSEAGAVRSGSALLGGLLRCAKCGARMSVRYGGKEQLSTYYCSRMAHAYAGASCQSIAGQALEQFVSTRVLDALKPAALELSLEAARNLERERTDLDGIWQKRLERSRYEVARAARQYRLVEPENRLVVRELERQWEEKLAQKTTLDEEYHRFQTSQPRLLTDVEHEGIRALAQDIPALWEAPTTTDQDRKEILRQVVERIDVDTEGNTERVGLTIHWAGGTETRGVMIRDVGRMTQLSYYPELCERVRALSAEGLEAAEIADRVTFEGYRAPRGHEVFTRAGISNLIRTIGCREPSARSANRGALGENEWWLAELARRISMPPPTLQRWIEWGEAKGRKEKGVTGRWILWADEAEIARLRERRNRGGYARKFPRPDSGKEE